MNSRHVVRGEPRRPLADRPLFASEHEELIPHMVILGKGLTERYLTLSITVISEKLFSASTKAIKAFRASITELWRRCNPSTMKNAQEVTA